MQVKVGSVSFLEDVGTGYGIGLDDKGHLIEFIADWRGLVEIHPPSSGPDVTHIHIAEWQILAIDDELRLPATPEGKVERARFVKAALKQVDRGLADRT